MFSCLTWKGTKLVLLSLAIVTSVMYRNFKTFNRAKFRNDIYNENWEFLDSNLDPNQMWTEWKTKFLQIVDKHAPIRTKRVRPKSCPWITAGLKERMHNRDTLSPGQTTATCQHNMS